MDTSPNENSQTVQKRVQKAFNVQQTRNATSNANLNQAALKKYCPLDKKSYHLLQQFSQKFGLSMRAQSRLTKVSRTIADLANDQNIKEQHLQEALSYRNPL